MGESLQPKLYRTHTVDETRQLELPMNIIVSGFVAKRRDFGSIVFVDLRDRTGVLQLVFARERGTSEAAMQTAQSVRNEYVVAVRGTLVLRDEKSVNPKIATGAVELIVEEIEVHNGAKNPPFYIQDGIDVDETVRLRYRYLDLRRPEMQQMLMLRHQVLKLFRQFLDESGFIEVETPILTKSTPEGARDYLVPSRLQPGSFYALPQSPQLFKQLLMVSGLERYYQVARCFRDEDLRADRQPEFTQLDIEMSFMPLEPFQEMMEQMIANVFKEALGVEISLPFERLPYQVAMERYGSDKPDLRFDVPIVDIQDEVKNVEFRAFQEAVAAGGVVKALVAPGCSSLTRKQTDELGQFVRGYGLKGLATVAVSNDGSIKSSIGKFLTQTQMESLITETKAKPGDLILIAAGARSQVLQALGALRNKLGADLKLYEPGIFKILWVTDFPLVSYDEEAGRYVAEHHPFTMPAWEDVELLSTDPDKVRAQAYDMVLNGFEIGGGSMRIFRRDIQEKMFAALGLTQEEANEKFGFLLNAFEYGAPQHGGLAFGIDRIVMIMGGRKSLRDCIAFPKTASGTDLMMDAPSEPTDAQLEVLHLEVQDILAIPTPLA